MNDIKLYQLIRVGLVFTVLIPSLALGCSKPQSTGEASDPIDTLKDPSQVRYKAKEPIVIKSEKDSFTLTPVAEYRVAAVIVGKKPYSFGWQAEISPLDLALAWGKLAEPEYDEYISYRQSNRWYYYRYKAGSPFDKKFVIAHSSNHHIIPATQNLRRALKTLSERQEVMLEGFLVNVKGKYRGRDVWWNSSLSRTDSGDGSCELLYVKRVQIDDEIFE